MKNLKSQPIIVDRNTKISKRSSNSFKYVELGFDIGKIRERNFIKLRLKMKNLGGFIIMKIVLKKSPSIKSTIIRTNNRLEKGWTNRTINPYANDVIKLLPFEIFRSRCFR